MTEPDVECELCHRPIRSAAARARRIGAGCWRKLHPAQRAAIRRNPAAARAALTQPVPIADGQLPLEEQDLAP
ncbi:hypothetical protein EF913_28430 [Streptomyces sp. WAC04189]|uniref:DUF6011 domain-containing protein n=1 Tax=Streptomyces sp. WAC04189 TaxID=2487411 RepID=UPI000F9CDC42|nr:DUF6011 domain-containing protein [Streptomyces sp. WAC04189]RSR98059.1 hypothetical protein EF913_28430 [Streptomyces sp. WAC04189]